MSGEQFVDVRYRGLEVGQRVKLHDLGPTTGYLELPAPLPVGSILEISTDEGIRLRVRVARVQEQVAGAAIAPGMRVVAQLDNSSEGWWRERAQGADPKIPEPRKPPVRAETGPVMVPSSSVPAAASGNGAHSATTAVMSAAEISAALEHDEGPAVVDASDGAEDTADADRSKTDRSMTDRSKTEVMSAVDIAAIEADARADAEARARAEQAAEQDEGADGDVAGDGSGNGAGNGETESGAGKRRRRRKKRRTRG